MDGRDRPPRTGEPVDVHHDWAADARSDAFRNASLIAATSAGSYTRRSSRSWPVSGSCAVVRCTTAGVLVVPSSVETSKLAKPTSTSRTKSSSMSLATRQTLAVQVGDPPHSVGVISVGGLRRRQFHNRLSRGRPWPADGQDGRVPITSGSRVSRGHPAGMDRSTGTPSAPTCARSVEEAGNAHRVHVRSPGCSGLRSPNTGPRRRRRAVG